MRLWRSILRRWPKAARVIASRASTRQGGGAAPRQQLDDARRHLRRRHEGRGRHVEQDARLASASRRAPRGGRNPSARARRRRCAPRPRAGTSSVSDSHQGGQSRPASQPVEAAACRRCRAGWRRSAPARRRGADADRRRAHRPRRSRAGPDSARRSRRAPARQRASRSTAMTRAAPAARSARVRPPGTRPDLDHGRRRRGRRRRGRCGWSG